MNPPNKNIPSFFLRFHIKQIQQNFRIFFSAKVSRSVMFSPICNRSRKTFSRSKSSPLSVVKVWAAEAAIKRFVALKVKLIHPGKKKCILVGNKPLLEKLQMECWQLDMFRVRRTSARKIWYLLDFTGGWHSGFLQIFWIKCVVSIRAWNLEDIYSITSSILLQSSFEPLVWSPVASGITKSEVPHRSPLVFSWKDILQGLSGLEVK